MYKSLFEIHKLSNKKQFYSDSTLEDLKIEQVFEKINYTSTPIGAQYLFYSLCKKNHGLKNACEIEKRISKFNKSNFFQSFKKATSKLQEEKCYYLLDLLVDAESLRINRFIQSYFISYPIALIFIFIFKLYYLLVPLFLINIYCYAHTKSKILYKNNGLQALTSFCFYINEMNKSNIEYSSPKKNFKMPLRLVRFVKNNLILLDVENATNKSFILNEVLSVKYIVTETIKFLVLLDSFVINNHCCPVNRNIYNFLFLTLS